MADAAKLRKPYLLLIAAIAWCALILQTGLVIKAVMADGQSPLVGIVNTFSYFTVLTNFLVATVCTASLLRDRSDIFLTRPSTHSAVAVYIFVVGLIYSLLLRSLWSPTGLNAVADIALHDVVPILYTLYWIFFVRKGTLRWSQPLSWLIYPLLYVVYCLVRGARIGFYPYHFVDPILLGYPKALTNTAFLLIGFWLLGLLAVAIDHIVGRSLLRRHTSQTPLS
jgi:hypothetical protein